MGELIAREAAFYRWANSHPAGTPLRTFLPELIYFDAAKSVLVLRLLNKDRTPDSQLVLQIRALATCLAACYGISMDRYHQDFCLPQGPPWELDLARPLPLSLRLLAPAQLEVFRAIQAEPRLIPIYDALREGWVPQSLTHGDLKWVNVFVEAQAGEARRVLLLDWELIQWGDPAWDLAAVFHAVLTESVLRLEIPRACDANQASQLLGEIIVATHQHQREFWDRYRAAVDLSDGTTAELLDRVPSYAGVRLIKSAYEWCQAERTIPRRAAAILQLGMNMILEPLSARRLVLGL